MLHIYHTSFYGLHGKGPLIAAHSTILLFLQLGAASTAFAQGYPQDLLVRVGLSGATYFFEPQTKGFNSMEPLSLY